jgi:nucleoside-diphosphate-sugar epimerase
MTGHSTNDAADAGRSSNSNPGATSYSFVTGGSGLVGSHVIQQLLKEGKKVKALYRNEIPDIAGKEKVTWVKGDILDVIALDEALEGVERVYHCAAIVSFNSKRKGELFKTNIEGTANVVNAALNAGVKKLCFVSSVAALGKVKNGITINEKMTWSEESNDSNYAKSKYLAEVEVWRGIAEGLQAVIVNPAIILGAADWNEGSTKIFKTAYEEFPWYTEGITGFVDVADVANVMIQLMASSISGEKFILSAENKQYKEVFTLAATAFGKKAPHKKVTRLIANIVWRLEALKAIFTGEDPLLTRETAEAAQQIVVFDNSKLKSYLPSFAYTPLPETIKRVCGQLKEKHKLRS